MIHILDDSRQDLELIEFHLKKSGVTDYRCFTSVSEFIDEMDETITVVLIDHNLASYVTGLDILKLVLKKNAFCYPIIVSGNDDISVVINYINNDCFRYILKSNPEYLNQVVRYIKEAQQRIEYVIKRFNHA